MSLWHMVLITTRKLNDKDNKNDDMPTLKTIIHEEARGRLYEENRIEERISLTDSVLRKRFQKYEN